MLTIEGFEIIQQRAPIVALTLAALLLTTSASSRADILYVSNWGNNTIEQFTPQGVGSVFANTGLDQPGGLAFDTTGNLYVANYGDNTIEKFTPGGVGSVFATAGLSSPYGLAFDTAGNLYVANYGDGIIEEFTPGGVGSVFANEGGTPHALAFDSSGNLYVSEEQNGLLEYTPQGVGHVYAKNVTFNPDGLAFDRAGNLYVACVGDAAILKFTPQGNSSAFVAPLNSPLSAPTFIAFQPVPEPSTWAMVGVGLSALLVFRRRKA